MELIVLAISVAFYSYAIYLRKKANKVEIFDKHGKLTGQAQFIIQKGVRKDSTIS